MKEFAWWPTSMSIAPASRPRELGEGSAQAMKEDSSRRDFWRRPGARGFVTICGVDPQSIDRSKYDVVPIGITAEGHWLAARNALALLPAKDAIQKTLTTASRLLCRRAGRSGNCGCDLPVLHGTYGEDGYDSRFARTGERPGTSGPASWVPRSAWTRSHEALLRDAVCRLSITGACGNRKSKRCGQQTQGSPLSRLRETGEPGIFCWNLEGVTGRRTSEGLDVAAEYDRKSWEQGVDAREIESACWATMIRSLPWLARSLHRGNLRLRSQVRGR